MPSSTLDPGQIQATIARLAQRVELRFGGSGLASVVRRLEDIARHTSETTDWIGRPLVWVRVLVGVVVLLIVAALAVSLRALQVQVGPPTLSELAQGIEATINDVVYVAVALFFLVTIETRVKRRRALRAIHELRAIAHVIDMHQLTKDPEWVLSRGHGTGLVAQRAMTSFELSRYLDYCSEALSLTGKVAALYVQRFDDSVALQAVNEVEELTTGLSRKVWQKLTVLYAMPPLASSAGAGASAATPAPAAESPAAATGSGPVAAPAAGPTGPEAAKAPAGDLRSAAERPVLGRG
jgi:hypothetical protein